MPESEVTAARMQVAATLAASLMPSMPWFSKPASITERAESAARLYQEVLKQIHSEIPMI